MTVYLLQGATWFTRLTEPRVDCTDTVVTHLRALINGEVDDWGDPATTESLPITTPEPIVQ